jgi:hypothetical protein
LVFIVQSQSKKIAGPSKIEASQQSQTPRVTGHAWTRSSRKFDMELSNTAVARCPPWVDAVEKGLVIFGEP